MREIFLPTKKRETRNAQGKTKIHFSVKITKNLG